MSETDAGLSELPNGWAWLKLGTVIQIIDYRGRTPPYSSDGIPHLRSSNIRNGNIIWKNLKYVTEETYDKGSDPNCLDTKLRMLRRYFEV